MDASEYERRLNGRIREYAAESTPGSAWRRAMSASWKSRARSRSYPAERRSMPVARTLSVEKPRPRPPNPLHALEKQPGTDEEEKAQGDLQQNEARAQTGNADAAPRDDASGFGLERAREVDLSRLQRRNQAHEERRDEEDAESAA